MKYDVIAQFTTEVEADSEAQAMQVARECKSTKWELDPDGMIATRKPIQATGRVFMAEVLEGHIVKSSTVHSHFEAALQHAARVWDARAAS